MTDRQFVNGRQSGNNCPVPENVDVSVKENYFRPLEALSLKLFVEAPFEAVTDGGEARVGLRHDDEDHLGQFCQVDLHLKPESLVMA